MLKVIIGVLLICLASNCSLEKSNKKKTSNDRNSTKTGQKQNGLVKSYRSDGKVSSAVNYKDGIKHGVSYAYYSNGKVNLELPYANGKRTGQSKRFYETGQLYQTTEYTNDKLNGWQKKYRENGDLLSEARYENDEPCLGLKEYLLDKTLKKNYPSIVIMPIDELSAKGKYTLKLSLSDGSKKVKFFEGSLSEGGCWHDNLNYVLLNEKTGIGEIVYTLPPGGFLMDELNFIAKVTTVQGNTYLTQRSFNLAIDN